MSIITKSRSLGLLIFIFSILSINIILILSQIFEFKDFPTPGNYFKDYKIYDAGDALQDKQGLAEHGFAIPYIDGSTSISRLGRVFPNYIIFKPLMISVGFFICFFWFYQKKFFSSHNFNKYLVNRMYIFGLITGVCLIIHIFFLGIKIDNNFYKLFIRVALGLSVLCSILSKYFFIMNAKNCFSQNIIKNNIFFRLQFFLVYILIFVLILSIPLLVFQIPKSYILIIEWNYFVLIFSFYILYYLSWKNYSFIQPPPKTL